MPTLTDCPQSNAGEWSFRIFGVPVHVKFWFWAACLLTGANQEETSAILIWVAVCFGSILLHELGHVCAFRLFGAEAEVVLYGWGGLAIPRRGLRGPWERLAVSLAGPAAGFCAAGLVAAAAWYAGARIHLGWYLFLPWLRAFPTVAAGATPGTSSYLWYILLNDLLFVNLYWGLVNLLPVYPLDGGQASGALFEQSNPLGGRRKSLILSAAVAVAIALAGILQKSGYIVVLFAVLAASSLQALEAERTRPGRSPQGW
ncbi:MAG TPA: site-2 protease family protein [Bryobacteraceae bacterium]|nr:site-2 protease family protein [Bryobacteraceae bacterium]